MTAATLDVAALVTAEAQRAGLKLPDGAAAACAAHHRLLVRWNRTHNLTRVTEPVEAARKHYLDCLWPLLSVPRDQLPVGPVADLGSGAGFPGLFVALVCAEHRVTLIEPAQKRVSFLRMAIAELALGARVTVADPPTPPVPWVTSRATFSRGERAPLAAAVAPGGHLWLWSVPVELEGWGDEVAALGLTPLPPLVGRVGDDPRVVLRAVRPT